MDGHSLLSDLQIDEPWGKELGGEGGEDGDEIGRVGCVDGGCENLAHGIERRLDSELAGHVVSGGDARYGERRKRSVHATWQTQRHSEQHKEGKNTASHGRSATEVGGK